MSLVREAIGHLRNERKYIAVLAALSLLSAQAESVAFILIALTGDAVVRDQERISATLGPLVVDLDASTGSQLALLMVLAGALFSAGFVYLQSKVSARIERAYRDGVITSFAQAGWEVQSRQRSGRLQGRLRLAMAAPEAFASVNLWVRGTTMLSIFAISAVFVSPAAAGVAVVLGSLLAGLVIPLRRRLRRLSHEVAKAELAYADEVSEASEQASDLAVYRAWPFVLSRLARLSSWIESARRRIFTVGFAVPMSYQYGGLLLIVLMLGIVESQSFAGNLGQVAASVLLLLRSVQFSQVVQQALQRLAESVPTLHELMEDLERPRTEADGTKTLGEVEELELRGVTYTYPGASRPALDHISLSLPIGRIVGLAGPSGSGKSTLAQILLRLRSPNTGDLLADGVSGAEYSQSSWYSRVTHVPQQPRLLHGTVAENIAFLDPTIGRGAIASAAHQVGLEALLGELPEGLDTVIGPSTHNLSGGQTQRIGIARALVRSPQVIVLDEPTSALDVESEAVIQEALARLREQRESLIVVIAHRPSTLSHCDEIAVLLNGRLESYGSPEGLLQSSDFFRKMVASTSELP